MLIVQNKEHKNAVIPLEGKKGAFHHTHTHKHTHIFMLFLRESMIYLLAGRPIKNQSGCLECAGNGKAKAVEEVGLINGHFHLVA